MPYDINLHQIDSCLSFSFGKGSQKFNDLTDLNRIKINVGLSLNTFNTEYSVYDDNFSRQW